MPLDPSIEEQRLVEEARQRRSQRLNPRERAGERIVGGALALLACALLVLHPPDAGTIELAPALVSMLAFVVALNVRFDVGGGYTVPTQLAFLPLAAALPPALLTPAVVLTLMLSRVPDVVTRREAPGRLWLSFGNAWFAAGPAVVLTLAGVQAPLEAGALVVAAAFAGQLLADVGASFAREALYGGASLREQARELWIYAVDLALTPIGLVVAAQVHDSGWAVVASLPLLVVLGVFARERRGRLRSLQELNEAYRGTAIVLGDVVEADDGYTGEHCRDVVALAMEVGERLGLDADRLRNLEFAALLHDVGKVAIPKTILNKPGKLTPDEWEVMKSHAVEGQRMLDRVGGFMCEVGLIVRAHHERWDGGGYPDGVAAEAIPLEARIIACCDTWNAMRTDRVYRKALPFGVARGELVDATGTQLDPQVVGAALAIVDREAAAEPELRLAA